jgi:hypothetical protein
MQGVPSEYFYFMLSYLQQPRRRRQRRAAVRVKAGPELGGGLVEDVSVDRPAQKAP